MQAAPFSAVALVERAQADVDWAAILDALRLRRRESQAVRTHVAHVEAVRLEEAQRAVERLQAAFHMKIHK